MQKTTSDINQVTSFIKYMMNRWSEKECAVTFPDLSGHMWDKWVALATHYGTDGAIPRFYCELDRKSVV